MRKAMFLLTAIVSGVILAAGVAMAQVTEPVVGGTVSSVDNGQVTTGDGLEFENHRIGETVMLANPGVGTIMLQTRQAQLGETDDDIYITRVSLKTDTSTLTYIAATNQFNADGREYNLALGQEMKLPDGGVVRGVQSGIEVTTKDGDVVTITDRGRWIDLKVEVGPNRQDGELRGALGNMDKDEDSTNDLVARDGTLMNDVDAFLYGWRVMDGEGILGSAPGEANRAPVAQDDNVTTNEDTTGELITLQATDAESDTLSYKVTDLPDHGKLFDGNSTAASAEITNAPFVLTGEQLTYVPDANYDSTDSFKFRANDGLGDSFNEATVSISVAPAPEDTTSPEVGLVTPSDGIRGVSRTNPNITATFSEQMGAFPEGSFKLERIKVKKGKVIPISTVAASVENPAPNQPDSNQVRLTPSGVLERGKTYRVTINTQAKDLAGNTLQTGKAWLFKTGKR